MKSIALTSATSLLTLVLGAVAQSPSTSGTLFSPPGPVSLPSTVSSVTGSVSTTTPSSSSLGNNTSLPVSSSTGTSNSSTSSNGTLSSGTTTPSTITISSATLPSTTTPSTTVSFSGTPTTFNAAPPLAVGPEGIVVGLLGGILAALL